MSSPQICLPRYVLELGKWEIDSLEALMQRLKAKGTTAGDSVVAWVDSLANTPFRFETRLPPIPVDTMRVRLASFDCITFAYHVLALAGSNSFDNYLRRLYALRYVPNDEATINNDPYAGNFIDFACEALLINAVQSGMLEDVTSSFVSQVEQVSMTLHPLSRPALHDPASTLVVPKYPGLRINTSVILTGQQLTNTLQEGDLIVFTRGAFDKNGQPQPTFVCHVGFVRKVAGVTSMIHATRHYYRCQKQPLPPVETLVGYPDHYLPGVVVAGSFLGDDYAIEHNDQKYHGYDWDQPRELLDYATHNFPAFKIFRPIFS